MRRSLTALILLGIHACGEGTPTTLSEEGPPSGGGANVVDGANGGNPHFFFLPPMAAGAPPSGTFDAARHPTVEICIFNGVDCGPSLELFNTATGPRGERVRVDPVGEQYTVFWNAAATFRENPVFPGSGETYRIRIIVARQVLGYADVEAWPGTVAHRDAPSTAVVPLRDDGIVPIRFRIDEGFEAFAHDESATVGGPARCTVDLGGSAYCWGTNGDGQLGIGTVGGHYLSPHPVTGGHQFASVSTGVAHSCGVTLEGEAYCWGRNTFGQLGTGAESAAMPAPALVAGNHRFVSVSAGDYSTCGVTVDGTGLCWGLNNEGQLGIGDGGTYTQPLPAPVVGGLTFHTIEARGRNACALTTAGTAYCWGYDDFGQVGQGDSGLSGGPIYRTAPAAIPGLVLEKVAMGSLHACGLTRGGDVYCWGDNRNGALGTGASSWHLESEAWGVPTPTKVSGGTQFEAVSAGVAFTCGVAVGGAAHCWGLNDHGQLGNGIATGDPTAGEPSPVPVEGALSFRSISAGWGNACGITTDAEAYCWGRNDAGQLGDGSLNSRPSPVFVMDLGPSLP